MAKWNLYWVTVPHSPDENCFVIAKNVQSAASYEIRNSGMAPGDAYAEFVDHLLKTSSKIMLISWGTIHMAYQTMLGNRYYGNWVHLLLSLKVDTLPDIKGDNLQ